MFLNMGMNRSQYFIVTVLLLLVTTIPTITPRRRRTVTSSKACPTMCICKSTALYCDRARLTWIPRQLPRDLSVLRLRDNSIRKLSRTAFKGMIDMRHLSLTRNKITHIDPSAFSDLYNLLTLSLSDNELTLLADETFKHQIYLKDLSLSRNRLANVELVLSPLENVQRLNLAENRISRITEETFGSNAAIRVLYLQNNRISYIERRAFKNLIHLVYLSLKDNPIVQVDIYLWANHHLEQLDATSCGLREVIRDTPPHLRDLRLAANHIEYIDDQSFEHIDQVHLLMLDDNLLQVIPNKALSKLTSLSDLHLTRNKLIELPQYLPNDLRALYAGENHIVRIANGTLNQLHRLRDLVLSYNRIHEIDEDSFRGLAHLISLDLSNNLIRRLARYTFTDNRNLQRLDLSNNPLHVFEPKCFRGLTSLHILQISNIASSVDGSGSGDANSVAGTIFRDLKSLLFLDLSNSSTLVAALVDKPRTIRRVETIQDLNLMNSGLTTIPSTLRVYLPYLRAVRLTGNPWHCDSRLSWISRWMASGVVQFYEPERMICDSPPSLKGRRLMDLTPAELRNAEQLQSSMILPSTRVVSANQTDNPVLIQFKRVRPQFGLSVNPTDISVVHGSGSTNNSTSSSTGTVSNSDTNSMAASTTAGSAISSTVNKKSSNTINNTTTNTSVNINKDAINLEPQLSLQASEQLQLQQFPDESAKKENSNGNHSEIQTINKPNAGSLDSNAVSQLYNQVSSTYNTFTSTSNKLMPSPDSNKVTTTYLNQTQNQKQSERRMSDDHGSGLTGLMDGRISVDESSGDEDYSII